MPFEPKKITKENILNAVKRIETEHLQLNPSTGFDVKISGKLYPPKEVMRYAHEEMNGEHIWRETGGEPTNKFLSGLGFEIIKKKDLPISMQGYSWVAAHKKIAEWLKGFESKQVELISVLKEVGATIFNDRDENGNVIDLEEIDPFTFFCYIYKHGNAKNLNVLQELCKKLKLDPIPVDINGMPTTNPQKVWMFPYKELRINSEIERLWNLFRSAMNTTISDDQFADVLRINGVGKIKLTEALFTIRPEDFLPINKQTEPYLSEIFKIATKFNTYSEYLGILEEVRARTDDAFYKISHDAFVWNRARNKISYWLFQCNPDMFDIESSLRDDILDDWNVAAHKEEIKQGDKVIIWVSGKNAGCYALAEVKSDPEIVSKSSSEQLWKTERSLPLKVKIEITHNAVDVPILRDKVKSSPDLADLSIGLQGTNFSATEKQYNTIRELIEESLDNELGAEKDLIDVLKSIGFTDSTNYFDAMDKIIQSLVLSKEDGRIAFTDRSATRLNFNIGNRYCLSRFVREGFQWGYIRSSDSKLPSGAKLTMTYRNPQNAEFYECKDFKVVSQELNEIISACSGELSRINKSALSKKDSTPFRAAAFDKTYRKNIFSKAFGDVKTSNMNLTLNTILYGPPGTGKTYRLKNEFFERFTDRQSTETKEEYYAALIKDLSWWEIIGAIMIDLKSARVQNIFEHPLLATKIATSENKTPKNTIWSLLQLHTKQDCPNVSFEKRVQPQFFWKDEDGNWTIDEAIVKDETPEFYDIITKYKNYKPQTKTEKRYIFTTFHQSFSYEDFIEGIKPQLVRTEEGAESRDIAYHIEDGIFKEISEKAKNNPDKDYAIFIDEINRGNIANIFGELITLIEDDKRLGASNEMTAILPYSKKEFGVPRNLYVIGTMNTADRSVEALDTALRRRFSFIEMRPDPTKLEGVTDEIALDKLLSAINLRIEKLLDRDYCIGHSYFMSIQNSKNPLPELKIIFQNKVLPLLQEYFYGDWGKIMLVIGKEFISKEPHSAGFLGLNEDFEEFDEKPVLRFIDSSEWTMDSFRSIYE
jgi:hypothetical protein